jgi:hypothetical protein
VREAPPNDSETIPCQLNYYTNDELPPCPDRAVLGDLCEYHARAVLGVEVRDSLISGAGRGLFTTKDRVIGDWICEFRGRLEKSQPPNEPSNYTLETDGGKVLIPSKDTDGFGRFVNDLRDEKRNNCVFISDKTYGKVWADPEYEGSDDKMYVVANKVIHAGQELTVSYGISYKWH